MRGTKAKLNRRRAEHAARKARAGSFASVSDRLFQKGGLGKTTVMAAYAAHVAKPRGTWKEFWPRLIRNISESNRLPRGFKEPVKSIFVDFDFKGQASKALHQRKAAQ